MDYAWLAVPIDTEWEAGYKYVYTLDFTNGAGYSDPLDGPETGGSVLGGAIKFTMEVNPWGDKSTMTATNSMLVGHWVAQRVEVVRSDDPHTVIAYNTPEEAANYLMEFYDFLVPDDQTLITTIRGEVKSSAFHITDNYVYMDGYKDDNGDYMIIPYIEYLAPEEARTVTKYDRGNRIDEVTAFYSKTNGL
jgi:hypothetical protein